MAASNEETRVAIPFSPVGILPAHAAMGAFFTATAMIGFIAGAGIVVRNAVKGHARPHCYAVA